MTNMNNWVKENTWLAKMNASKRLDGWDNYKTSKMFLTLSKKLGVELK